MVRQVCADERQGSLSGGAPRARSKVISGPGDGFGGAEWSLYAQDQQIAGYQALLQTLLVPKATKQLRVGITCWVREAGLFGRPKEWLFDTASFTIDVER